LPLLFYFYVIIKAMNLFNFGKNKKEEVVAVLDIASASVGGMIIRTQKDQSPEILTSARVPVNFLLDVNFQAFWRSTRGSLEKVISQMMKDSPKSPDRIFCVFSSPWFISQTRVVSVKRSEPFEITESFFDKLVKNEIKIFKSKWQSKTPRLNKEYSESEVLEHDIMNVSLNGYQTQSPFGKKAQKIDASIYISLGIKKLKDEIEEIILENFGSEDISFHTVPLVVFTVLENIINPETGYLFVDIGGETSDISLVRKNILEETVSFPLGRNTLTRKTASRFKIPLKEAESLIHGFRKGHIGGSDAEKISAILDKSKKEWRDLFEKSLSEISDNGPLPRSLFLVGAKDNNPEFAECAGSEDFSKFTILEKPFEVEQILSGGLKEHFNFKRTFEKDKDIFLMIESLFANHILWQKK